MSTANTILLRKPTVLSMTGFGTTTLYDRIKAGLFTRPIRIGARLSAWRASEVDEINRAIVAGKSDEEIRALVQLLENARAAEASSAITKIVAPMKTTEQDAARYRQWCASGLPMTYRGIDYEDKESLDAAIDADLSEEGKAS